MENSLPTALSAPLATQMRNKKLCAYAVLVALFSLAGWAVETLTFYFMYGDFFDRGLLTLPFCPLYGLSAFAVYALLRTPQTGIWSKLSHKPHSKAGRVFATVGVLLCYALAAAALATAIEGITGFFYHRVFGIRLWNYEGYPLNLFGYVCLQYALLWGVLIVAAMGLVWYPLQKALMRAPFAPLAVIAGILSTAITFDFLFNMFHLIFTGYRFLT